MRIGIRLVLALLSLLVLPCGGAVAKLMTWPDLLGRPLPQATDRIAYGGDPNQFAELWLPNGKGPFPVVLMIHGGCWQAAVAKLTIMNYIAEDLRRRGVAVWNLEYRAVDQAGGGFPGTFLDAAKGADALRSAAAKFHLKLDRVVAVGHSAGGHLVLWLAGRHRIARSSPLFVANPLPIAAVVSLGGLPDLPAARARGDASCGTEAIDQLVGPPTKARPDPYQETSVPTLLPLGVPQVLFQGDLDPISPPELGQSYVAAAVAKHDDARVVVLPDSGHAELIAPGTAAWEAEAAEIVRLAEGKGRR